MCLKIWIHFYLQAGHSVIQFLIILRGLHSFHEIKKIDFPKTAILLEYFKKRLTSTFGRHVMATNNWNFKKRFFFLSEWNFRNRYQRYLKEYRINFNILKVVIYNLTKRNSDLCNFHSFSFFNQRRVENSRCKLHVQTTIINNH